MTNWVDGNPLISKKDEVFTNQIDDNTKGIVHNNEITNDNDSLMNHVIQEHNLNHNYQNPGSLNGSITIISPKGSSNNNPPSSNKHAPSNFAAYATSKPTLTKAQSDKVIPKEKKQNEQHPKEVEGLFKRPSIEKNLESGQNLIDCLLQNQGQQNVFHHTAASVQPVLPFNHNVSQNNSNQQRTEHDVSHKDSHVETNKDARFEKLTVNTNLSSPPEKSSQTAQGNPEMTSNLKSHQKPLPLNQLNTMPSVQKRLPHIGTGSSTPTNMAQGESTFQTASHSNNPAHPIPHTLIGQTTTNIQPSSATLKPSGNLLSHPSNPSLSNVNTKTNFNAAPTTNPIAQKLSLVSPNSTGNLQSHSHSNPPTYASSRSMKNMINPSPGPDPYLKNLTKPSEISQTPYMKLQAPEVFEKIKVISFILLSNILQNHKLSGTLRIQEGGMNIEDVKMLQVCLELLTESDILSNGHFNHYTENLLKIWQKAANLPVTGVVDQLTWENMISTILKGFIT